MLRVGGRYIHMGKLSKRFIHYNSEVDFQAQLNSDGFEDDCIVFVKDIQKIYTHGQFYNGEPSIISDSEIDLQKITPLHDSDSILLRSAMLGKYNPDASFNLVFRNNTRLLGHIACVNYSPYVRTDIGLGCITFPVTGGTTYTVFQDVFEYDVWPKDFLGPILLVNKNLEGRTYSYSEDFVEILLIDKTSVQSNYWQFTPSQDGYLLMNVDLASSISKSILSRLMIYEGTDIKEYSPNTILDNFEKIDSTIKNNTTLTNGVYNTTNLIKITPAYNIGLSNGGIYEAAGRFSYLGVCKVIPGQTYAFIGCDLEALNLNGGFVLSTKDQFDKNGFIIYNSGAKVQGYTASTSFSNISGHELENVKLLTIPTHSDSELYLMFNMQLNTLFYTYDYSLANFVSIQKYTNYESLDFKELPVNPYNFFKPLNYKGYVNCYDPEKHIYDDLFSRSWSTTQSYISTGGGKFKAVMIPVISGQKYTIKTANNSYDDSAVILSVCVRNPELLSQKTDTNMNNCFACRRLSLENYPNGKNGIGKVITIPIGYNTLIFNGINSDTNGTQSKYDIKVCVGEQIVDEDFNEFAVYGNRSGIFKSTSTESQLPIIDTNLSWCTLGDSITWYNDNSNNGYQRVVMKAFTFSDYVNEGVSGWTMKQYAQALQNGDKTLPASDIYTIAYGINDWGQSIPVGTIEDFKNNTGVNTFAGALRIIIDKIYDKNINAFIFIMTPRKAYNFSNFLPANWYDSKNGIYLKEYTEVLIECANWYSLPVIDIFNKSQANDKTLVNLSIDSALHPNQKGYDLMAALIINAFKECLPIYK